MFFGHVDFNLSPGPPKPRILIFFKTAPAEIAVRRFQKQNGHLDPEAVKKIRWGF
jgi:hypothetical protein